MTDPKPTRLYAVRNDRDEWLHKRLGPKFSEFSATIWGSTLITPSLGQAQSWAQECNGTVVEFCPTSELDALRKLKSAP